MKRTLFTLVALSLLPVAAVAKPLEWSGVQAVGGVRIGTPYAKSGQWYLPVEADVSGLKGGTVVNSGLGCAVTARPDGGTLLVTVDAKLAGSLARSSAKCEPVKLGHIKAGGYDVVYRSPSEPDQALGRIDIAP